MCRKVNQCPPQQRWALTPQPSMPAHTFRLGCLKIRHKWQTVTDSMGNSIKRQKPAHCLHGKRWKRSDWFAFSLLALATISFLTVTLAAMFLGITHFNESSHRVPKIMYCWCTLQENWPEKIKITICMWNLALQGTFNPVMLKQGRIGTFVYPCT